MFRTLKENERGVIFRLGRFLRVAGPGMVAVLPVLDRMHVVDLDQTLPGWQGFSFRELDAMVAFLVLQFPEVPAGLRPEAVLEAMRQATEQRP